MGCNGSSLRQAEKGPATRRDSLARGFGKASDESKVPGGGGFYIGEEIARGGMSIVYQCSKSGSKLPYACKVINKKKLLYGYGVSSRQREKEERHLHNEIRALQALDHPNIVKVHHVHENDMKIYIVMELCSEGELFDFIIESKSLNEGDASRIARQVAGAVAYSHAQGFVHRDLKPDNLLLKNSPPSAPDDIKIADYGFAMAIDNPTKSILGTPGYVAPEIRMKIPYDEKVDVWSLGVIYYVMLIGYLPYDAETEVIPGHTTMREVEQKFKLDIDNAEWKHISTSAKDLLWRMLQADPKKRISAAEVRDHPWVKGETAKSTGNLASIARLGKERKAKLGKQEMTLADELYLGCCGPISGGKTGGRTQGMHKPSQVTAWDDDGTVAPVLTGDDGTLPRPQVLGAASLAEAKRKPGMRKGSDMNLGLSTLDATRLSAKQSQTLELPSVSVRFGFVSQRGFNIDDMLQPNRDCMGMCMPPLPGLTVGEDEPFGACADSALWVVCDGHGEHGHRCARFVRHTLPLALGKHLQINLAKLTDAPADGESGSAHDQEIEAVAQAFEAAVAETNELMRKQKDVDDNWSGASMIAVLILHNTLHIANVGDSRVVLAQEPPQAKKSKKKKKKQDAGAPKCRAVDLTMDQTPLRDDERRRIEEKGARVRTLAQLASGENEDDDMLERQSVSGDTIKWMEGDPPRVWVPQHLGQFPGTAFTRSIGDRSATDTVGLICEPEVWSHTLLPSEDGTPRFFVMGTDGLFAFLTSQTVVELAEQFDDPLTACKSVVAEAYAMWLQCDERTDHITMVCVRIDSVREGSLGKAPPVTLSGLPRSDPKESINSPRHARGSNSALRMRHSGGRSAIVSSDMNANLMNPARFGGGGDIGSDSRAKVSHKMYSRRSSPGQVQASAAAPGDGSARSNKKRRSSRKLQEDMEEWREQLQAMEQGQPDPGEQPGVHADRRRRMSAAGERMKTPEELLRIGSAVRANVMFRHLNSEQRFAVFRSLKRICVPAGQVVPGVKQGDPTTDDSCFYVVDGGSFEVRVKPTRGKRRSVALGEAATLEAQYGPVVQTYDAGVGGHFGELALMRDAPRAATVIATDPSRDAKTGEPVNVLWALRRSAFQEILLKSSMHDILTTLRRVGILATLHTQELQRLAELLTEVHFEPGDLIIKQGDVGDTFFIVVSGSAMCSIADARGGEVEVMRLGPNDYFGERALLTGEPRAASVRALGADDGGSSTGVRCLYINRDAFEEVLGPLRDLISSDAEERQSAALASIKLRSGEKTKSKKSRRGSSGGAVRMEDVEMTLDGGGRR